MCVYIYSGHLLHLHFTSLPIYPFRLTTKYIFHHFNTPNNQESKSISNSWSSKGKSATYTTASGKLASWTSISAIDQIQVHELSLFLLSAHYITRRVLHSIRTADAAALYTYVYIQYTLKATSPLAHIPHHHQFHFFAPQPSDMAVHSFLFSFNSTSS